MLSSIAFHVARFAQEQGAEVVLTSFGRTMKITSAIAKRLPQTPPVVELDVTNDDDLAALADRVREHVPHLDGVLHSIGFAPQGAFNFMERRLGRRLDRRARLGLLAGRAHQGRPAADGPWGQRRRPHLRRPVRLAGLRLDGRGEGCVRVDQPLSRPRPGPQGHRCNIVAAGPIRTTAAKSIPGFERFEEEWDGRSPLGWDVDDAEPTAKACVALLSDWFPATTGEMLHVDGGFHAMGV